MLAWLALAVHERAWILVDTYLVQGVAAVFRWSGLVLLESVCCAVKVVWFRRLPEGRLGTQGCLAAAAAWLAVCVGVLEVLKHSLRIVPG